MAYMPELSQRYSGILRRIAWTLGIPMTKTLARVMEEITRCVDNKRVCDACRDRSFCGECPFRYNE